MQAYGWKYISFKIHMGNIGYTLFEFDLRCSQLGDIGLFCIFDRKEHFDRQVPRIPLIDDTEIFQSPVLGRAAIRAEVIDKLSKESQKRYTADWLEIMDQSKTKNWTNKMLLRWKKIGLAKETE